MEDKIIVKKVISFGKVDYNGTGRKINECTIEIGLKYNDNNSQPVFSASGAIWNDKHTDWLCGGQMLDELLEFFPENKKLKEIVGVWEVWHLKVIPADIIKKIKSW